MNDRSAGVAVGLALAGHLLLLGLLSVAWGQQQPRTWPKPTPLEVSLVTEVAPEAQAPPAPEPPAPSIAPDQGLPEDASPPPVPVPEPATPAPPVPVPAPPAPAKPAPPQPPIKPAAKPAPAPKPAPAKPAPAKPAPVKTPAAAKATPAKAAAAKSAAATSARPRSDRLAGLSLGTGANPAATASRPRGARLGDDFLKGLSADAPRRPASTAAPGAKPGPYPTASIVQAIARQIQPCADRQVNPGPGANRIVTTLNIRLNPDGTLAATPTKQRQSGVNDENERYAQRVVDLGVAAFKGCSPLKLPSEYYQTASGGWNNINYQWQLR
ncbi:cell envelope biogenesis protein TolA [Sphingomonas sp.]|uniref:cell envelope biogenesis protein TolA n=1 Tax=Sphingomonas sp. TaxID=28214 RepID=UPI002D7ECE83|nr:cell envelope biogenesis protein TolA [Sphingomonas sp.]HEU0043052.1 cell envelope biogenesis protein TolA [Sphingomonas sp.]